MRFSDFKGRPVVSVTDARRLGFVDTLMLDRATQQILGLRIRQGGLISHHDFLLLRDVRSVGGDAVTVDDPSNVNEQSKFPELEGCADLGSVLGGRVLKEDGHLLGSVSDVEIAGDASAITGYMIGMNLLERLRRHEEHVIPATEVKSLGDSLVVVSNAVKVDGAG
ncbi:MAG: PRC-barrel domain-containing protein [Chloroflexota bacterium]